jgi:hypothetical protein
MSRTSRGRSPRATSSTAFRRLTPEHRAEVVLHHHLGYPLTEIAATLGIPAGTARSRLAAIPAPPEIAFDHAASVTQARDMLILVGVTLDLLANGDVTEARAVDQATDPIGAQITGFELSNGLVNCP